MCDQTKTAARETIFLKLLVLCATGVNLSFYISHLRQPYFLDPLIHKTSVVQRVDNTYPLDKSLSTGKPNSKQLVSLLLNLLNTDTPSK